MNYYKKHNILPTSAGINTATDVIEVNRVVSLASVAKAAKLDLIILSALNPSYKKQIINGSQARPKQLVMPLLSKQVYSSVYDALNTQEVHKDIYHTEKKVVETYTTKKYSKSKDKYHPHSFKKK